MDDLQRMAGGWKELFSVSEGFDRTLFAAFLEKGYVFSDVCAGICAARLSYVF